MAERGDAANMEDVARAAGISRATLYRYFPNREALLHAMSATSIDELRTRIADADLRGVSVEQAIARLVRGLVAIGSKYVVLSRRGFEQTRSHPNADTILTEPLPEIFRRGIADGSLRADLNPELLTNLFSGLIKAALDATSSGRTGVEQASAAVSSLFLNGTRA